MGRVPSSVPNSSQLFMLVKEAAPAAAICLPSMHLTNSSSKRTGRWRGTRGLSLPPRWWIFTVCSTRWRMNCTPCGLQGVREAQCMVACESECPLQGVRCLGRGHGPAARTSAEVQVSHQCGNPAASQAGLLIQVQQYERLLGGHWRSLRHQPHLEGGAGR